MTWHLAIGDGCGASILSFRNFNFKRVALTSGIRGSVCEVCGKIEDVFDESE